MMPSPARYRLLDLALERGVLPDALLRAGSRYGAVARVRREARGGVEAQEARAQELVERMSSGPIAEHVQSANDQHYELPAEFFGLFLGPRRKYSGCLWDGDADDLATAEDAMLRLTCERAGLRDGMRVLDLGCGWGSLSLWIAEHYPACQVVAVSNSHGQREWIEAERDRRGWTSRLDVRTEDVNTFNPGQTFDRVLSIEMFEHLRNWAELLRRISTWLEPDGRLFVHVFSQRRLPYRFEGTWAAERFFTAGTMPSHELLGRFQHDLVLERRWAVDGTHYARTLAAWLERLDAGRDAALAILQRTTGSPREARRRLATWRLFLLSTYEIWNWRSGNEWLVSHYLLAPR